jgi:hypothetical protein
MSVCVRIEGVPLVLKIPCCARDDDQPPKRFDTVSQFGGSVCDGRDHVGDGVSVKIADGGNQF